MKEACPSGATVLGTAVASRLDMTTAEMPSMRSHKTDVPLSLKILYVYTIVGSGVFGLWMLLAPASVEAAFLMPAQDPFVFGYEASALLAFGVVAAIGLRAPLTFAPVFVLQLVYKSIWLAVVFLPHLARGPVPLYAWLTAVVFVSYVVLDFVAIPFSRLRA